MSNTKIVPIEPTHVMLVAGVKAFQHAKFSGNDLEDWRAFYRAAISAAGSAVAPSLAEPVAQGEMPIDSQFNACCYKERCIINERSLAAAQTRLADLGQELADATEMLEKCNSKFIVELENERDELRRKLAKLDSENTQFRADCGKAMARIADLKSGIDEANKRWLSDRDRALAAESRIVEPERPDNASLSKLRGMAEGALGGKSSSEYIDMVRNADW